MNLRQLQHLVAIAEHQSFRKAADALFLTQSALSRSIQSLEEELEVKLIDRNSRKNVLTAYGQYALTSARRVIVEAAELKRGVALMKSGELGSIAIGYGSGPAAVLEVAFFQYLATSFPGVAAKSSRGSTDLLVRSLRAEQLDVLVIDRRSLTITDDLNIQVLPPLRGGFICRKGHPLLAEAPVGLDALRRYPNASTPLSPEVGRSLSEGLGPAAHPDRLMTIVGQDIDSLLDVVETTDTIFFGILSAARGRMEAGDLVELESTLPAPLYGNFALVTLAGEHLHPHSICFPISSSSVLATDRESNRQA